MRKNYREIHFFGGFLVKIVIIFTALLFLSVSRTNILLSQQGEETTNVESLPGYPEDQGYDVEIIGLDNQVHDTTNEPVNVDVMNIEAPLEVVPPAAGVEELPPMAETSADVTENLEIPASLDTAPIENVETIPAANVEAMPPSGEVSAIVTENLEIPASEVMMPNENLTTGNVAQVSPEPLAAALPEQTAVTPVSAKPGETAEVVAPVAKVSLDFKEADIRNVLRILSYKSGVNIVASPEVAGLVTIRLTDVPWDKALAVILETYGYGFERKDNIISVYPMAMLTARKQEQADLAAVQPTVTKVIKLKFTDASDMRKVIEPQLSPRGKITVLEATGQAGWEFGGAELGKRKRTSEKVSKSKMLVISDIPPVLEKLEEVISKLDKRPQQVLIETRILEVNRDKLRDLGLEFGTGSDAASFITTTRKGNGDPETQLQASSQSLRVAPSTFSPVATSIGSTLTGTTAFNSGLTAYFKKVTGSQFEVILHALEEDVQTNTLSAPRILTLSDQEATILVGTKYPILTSQISTESASTVTTTLDYYQDIGIQLNVVPQVSDGGYINLILHPAVTAKNGTVGTNLYPIIDTRETETQVLIKDGETVVIGGLLKDVRGESEIGIPVLSKIPIIGWAFKRKVNDIQKIDLLIFITASVVKEDEDMIILKENVESPVRSIVPAEVVKDINKENEDNKEKK